MSNLLQPLTLRGLTLPNRIWLSPMCQYSAGTDGVPNSWHQAHYGARAVGGFGLMLTEATAVTPEGRITNHDVGLWNDAQMDAWREIVAFSHAQGTPIGVQLAHAGRKASVAAFVAPGRSLTPQEGQWTTVAPSAIAFPGYAAPIAAGVAEIDRIVSAFGAAAERANEAGFDVVEVHAAHGYLVHEFLSPLSNTRTDEYGGSLENRARLLIAIIKEVRRHWPDSKPVFIRYSATDWIAGGVTPDEIANVSVWAAAAGADFSDVSTGGVLPVPGGIPVKPSYQVPAAQPIKAAGAAPVSVVGLITHAAQAEAILGDGRADAVMVARAALRDPMWPRRVAFELGEAERMPWPNQYARGAFRS